MVDERLPTLSKVTKDIRPTTPSTAAIPRIESLPLASGSPQDTLLALATTGVDNRNIPQYKHKGKKTAAGSLTREATPETRERSALLLEVAKALAPMLGHLDSQINKLLVYGSVATEKAIATSDIDLAVITNQGLARSNKKIMRDMFYKVLDDNRIPRRMVHFQFLSDDQLENPDDHLFSDPSFRESIKKRIATGKAVYQREKLFHPSKYRLDSLARQREKQALSTAWESLQRFELQKHTLPTS